VSDILPEVRCPEFRAYLQYCLILDNLNISQKSLMCRCEKSST
jgi:hypothetical protein